MNLKERLTADLKDAMKTKNEVKKSTVTMLRAAIKQIEIDSRSDLDDEGIIEIAAKQVKQRKGAIEEFERGGRPELADQARLEIQILMEYLPKQLSDGEIKILADDAIIEAGATSPKDMGKVMAILTQKIKGVADGKAVSNIVKEKLSNL